MISKNAQKVILILSATISTIGAITALSRVSNSISGMAVYSGNAAPQGNFVFVGGMLVFIMFATIATMIYRNIERQ